VIFLLKGEWVKHHFEESNPSRKERWSEKWGVHFIMQFLLEWFALQPLKLRDQGIPITNWVSTQEPLSHKFTSLPITKSWDSFIRGYNTRLILQRYVPSTSPFIWTNN
jgi:hypothetical protein